MDGVWWGREPCNAGGHSINNFWYKQTDSLTLCVPGRLYPSVLSLSLPLHLPIIHSPLSAHQYLYLTSKSLSPHSLSPLPLYILYLFLFPMSIQTRTNAFSLFSLLLLFSFYFLRDYCPSSPSHSLSWYVRSFWLTTYAPSPAMCLYTHRERNWT